jgi:hypothetical protein
MRIPIGKNKKLEISVTISQQPNLKELEKELKEFFSENEIEGIKVREFRIEEDAIHGYKIIPLEPSIEEVLSGGAYREKLREIGKKYGLEHFGFIYWCYHK